MRCSTCEKFTSLDTDVEPEVDDAEVSGTTVTVEARRELQCADCGETMKTASWSLEAEVPEEANDLTHDADDPDADHEWEVVSTTGENTERTEGKGRGLKTYRGVSVEVALKCGCGATTTVTLADDTPASGWDEEG